ncbi:calcium-dependent phosphotriesterase [Jackrogersella minutella]|nr:calcium-dependent phosphotriesterase [Jackrogersella minutella]
MPGPVPPRTTKTVQQRNAGKSDRISKMTSLLVAVAVLATGILVRAYGGIPTINSQRLSSRQLPDQAQVIDWKSFNVLPNVLPATVANASEFFFIPPGHTLESLNAKPFHIYDDEFLDVIGSNPTLTLIADSGSDELFHEATLWYPSTDEVFFVQNAGAKGVGTGLNKSNVVSKIALSEAVAVSNKRNATGSVNIEKVDTPDIVNSNGAAIYQGQILFTTEGQGANIAPNLVLMNPKAPYNTTVILNNYFGRQFNSLNDLAINPRNKELYFTDTLYGYLQDFRPAPGLRNQVYRYNSETGAVAAVADGFGYPNGITFSPNGSHVYITDTGLSAGFFGWNFSNPASLYRYDVQEDGTFSNRQLFAYVDSGGPDGIHCDSNGNVYTGTGDGVQVFNPSGKLIGKIFLGLTSANFNFAGDGRFVICAEEYLYYANIAAVGGAYVGDL